MEKKSHGNLEALGADAVLVQPIVATRSSFYHLALGLLGFTTFAFFAWLHQLRWGLGTTGRTVLFGLFVLGVAWHVWRRFVPLAWSINPVYAAHTIEKASPSLKNSLLNLLLFRGHRRELPPKVYHALEQQAAARLSASPIDDTIDRGALLRLGYALLAVVEAGKGNIGKFIKDEELYTRLNAIVSEGQKLLSDAPPALPDTAFSNAALAGAASPNASCAVPMRN